MPVLVTGGASFIGSHLVRSLVRRGARVRIVDNFSSGRNENIRGLVKASQVTLLKGNLLDPKVAAAAVRGMRVVFHLAADHGGRGYVDLHQVECATNLALDSTLFQTARKAGVEKVVYASSGCVYPNFLQKDPNETVYLKEPMVGPPYDADNMYGWAKLMAEMTLRAYVRQFGMKAAICRFFTVYGPFGVENHAIIAMIARAFIREDPFIVWGTGEQIRNWTYVDDIVEGTIAAAEKIDDGTAVNLGTMERIRVLDAVQRVIDYASVLHKNGYRPKIETRPDMPTGPLNRVADPSLARQLTGWEPKVMFEEGLKRTMEWYFSSKKKGEARKALRSKLTDR